MAAALARGRHELAAALFGDMPPDQLATYTQVRSVGQQRHRDALVAAE
jgi:hypothetical protein